MHLAAVRDRRRRARLGDAARPIRTRRGSTSCGSSTPTSAALPLTANQSIALWRRVVAESRRKSASSIGHAGAAEWAAGAWQLLHRWQIDPLRSGPRTNQARLSRLLELVPPLPRMARRQRLDRSRRARGALPAAAAARRQARGRGSRRVVPGASRIVARSSPRAARRSRRSRRRPLRVRCRRSGSPTPPTSCERRSPGRGGSSREAAQRASPSSSPTAARRQTRSSGWRSPSSATRAPLPYWSEGRTLAAEPAIGAAFDALGSLTGTHAPYATFGRWLRSPFFAAPRDEQFARARLDAELRARAALAAAVPSRLSLRR